MCDYKLLAHTEDGYIILCHSCHQYQLAFGTTAVTLSPGKFKKFCRQVNRCSTENDLPGFEKQKRIPLDLFTINTLMILSYSELTKLRGLLNECLFNEEIEQVFKDLTINRT